MSSTIFFKSCKEILESIEKDSNNIIDDINSFLKENKSNEDIKKHLKTTFSERINKFRSKYQNAHAGIIKNSEVIDIDPKCYDKMIQKVDYLMNYIDNLKLS